MKKYFKKEYKTIVDEINVINKEIKELEKDANNQKKIEELKQKEYELQIQEKTVKKYMIREEYQTCNHQLMTFNKYDYNNKTSHDEYVCLKCGLTPDILKTKYVDILDDEEKVMYDYLKDNTNYRRFFKSNHTNITGDPSLVHSIYQKVKEHNPKANDKTVIKYVEIALDNIRNKKMTYEREDSRNERLNLEPLFDRWHEYSISDRQIKPKK